jgi:hypothetical protein
MNNWAILFKLLFKPLDPAVKRYLVRLKFRNTALKFRVFRLECSYIFLNFRLTLLEFRVKGWRRFCHVFFMARYQG